VAVNLFTFVDLYIRLLDSAAHLLKKGADHAAKIGASEKEMLDWRLIDDMQPLSFQLKVVINFSKSFPARVAGLAVPAEIATESELSLAEYYAAIAQAKSFLQSLKPEQFTGRDDVPLEVELASGAMKPTLPAGRWITVFATTNLYFHLSTAYGILRHKGVPIGKVDLFSTGL
jgi:hypothetical protein